LQSSAISHQFPDHDKVIDRIGHMARTLHDTMRELGHDKNLERAAPSIPDAGNRLNYVATMVEKATERVLNATDAAQPVVEKIEIESQRLAREWQKLFDKKLDVEQFKGLVMQTHAFLADVPRQTKATNAYLMEIMMAQDFNNLTGQAVKKVVAVMQQTEKQLLELLVENNPSTANSAAYAGMLNGPEVNTAGRTDAAISQDQAEQLLGSLGF
ncbi:MAG: protein phosphatase CheZ, partial [Betaproteobacteria bacterium]|nr:protein phosphatase CheZ [Betaproteobacteria bacterium]